MQFSEFLTKLEQRGQPQKAQTYRQQVTQALQATLTEQQILALPLREVLSFFETFNTLVATSKTNDTINKRITELQNKGYCVMRGKNFG